MLRRLFCVLWLAALPLPALAQAPGSSVGWSGSATAGHCVTILSGAGPLLEDSGTTNCGGSATSLVVGTTTITSGTNGDVEFNNSGVLGELGTSGTGSLARVGSPTFSGTVGLPDSGTLGSGGLNGSNVGATTPGTGAFTTLSASSTVSGLGFSTYLASPPAIGSAAPNTGKFTTATIGAGTAITSSGPGGALTAGAYAAAGQLPGTATNDNATAANVGEYQQTGLNNISSGTTVTISNGGGTVPGVITYTAHPFSANCLNGAAGVKCVQPVFFTTSVALPTGLTASTTYYVDPASITTNTFQVATTAANALAGTDVITSSAGTGTQTAFAAATAATNNIFNVFALQLSAGDWRISFHPVCNGGTTTLVQYLQSAAFNTAGGLATPATGGTSEWSWGATGVALFATAPVSLNIDNVRFSTASTALVYGNIDSLYTTSTLFCTGSLSATRVR